MKLKHVSLSIMMMGASTLAMASGYHFGSQSVSSQGTAHANGAEAADASVLFYNPAGMSLLDGTNFSGGVTLVVPDSTFTNNGSKNVVGQKTSGGNGGDFAPSSVAAPSLYMTHQLNDKIHVGLGIFVPYGAKLDYDKDWAGRYALQNIGLETINFNPSISFKLDERQSIGAGISAQYMKASLAKAVDVPGGVAELSAAALGGDPVAIAKRNALLSTIIGAGVNPALLASLKDGQAKLNADGWGYGFNLGYMLQLNDQTRLGLAYRSNIHHKLSGKANWDFTGASSNATLAHIIGVASGHADSDGSVVVDTPESVSANVFHNLNDKVDLMADVTWTRHSRMDSIDIKFDGTKEGDLVIRQGWKDTIKVSVGGNYKLSESLKLRAGVAYDQSPVKNSDLRHPALPDSDRYWLSMGANYKLSKQSSVDFAYSYVMFKNADINYKDACSPNNSTCTGNGETARGSYNTNLQFLGVQYNHRF